MYTIFYKRFIDYDVIFEICLMGSACIQINCCRRAFTLVAADGVLRFRSPQCLGGACCAVRVAFRAKPLGHWRVNCIVRTPSSRDSDQLDLESLTILGVRNLN